MKSEEPFKCKSSSEARIKFWEKVGRSKGWRKTLSQANPAPEAQEDADGCSGAGLKGLCTFVTMKSREERLNYY